MKFEQVENSHLSSKYESSTFLTPVRKFLQFHQNERKTWLLLVIEVKEHLEDEYNPLLDDRIDWEDSEVSNTHMIRIELMHPW